MQARKLLGCSKSLLVEVHNMTLEQGRGRAWQRSERDYYFPPEIEPGRTAHIHSCQWRETVSSVAVFDQGSSTL